MEAIRQQRIENRRIARPKLEILVRRDRPVPFVEGLRMANEKNLVIASNARLDRALIGSNEWKSISDGITCWSGTMTGYEKPGKKFGKSVVYTDPETKQRYIFPVPEDYKGTRDALLIVNHPDYTLEKDGKDLVVISNPENISLVEKFPPEEGWYTGEKYGVPLVSKVSFSSDDARYLWRIDSRVGPVVRGNDYGDDCDFFRGVYFHDRPSFGLGMVVEATKNNTKKGDGK